MAEAGAIPNEGDTAADQHHEKDYGAHDPCDGAGKLDQSHDLGQRFLPAHDDHKQSSRAGVFMSACRQAANLPPKTRTDGPL